jgi:hypothetical protein
LDEFSPTGQFFSLCSFLKVTEVAHIFGARSFHGKKFCIDFDKNGLGYILGDFFANSSGHPA